MPLSRQRAAARQRDASIALRLACGNGLRPDVWDAFGQRFRIPHILEFYAATEGNVTLFNFDERKGARSAASAGSWRSHFPIRLVRFDVATEQPMRDAHGLCVPCQPDEIGEAIGQIMSDPGEAAGRFEGYATAPKASARSCATCSSRATPGFAPAT